VRPKDLSKRIIKILTDKKAEDILLIDVRRVLSPYVSYFVVATATSETHSRALTDEIRQRVKEKGIMVSHIEGCQYGHWVLMDYIDVVVHVFLPEERKYYALEDLWGDMPTYRFGQGSTNPSKQLMS
jgi:ribosome-associated protein